MKAAKQIRLLGLVVLISSCSKGSLYMEKKFNGFWADTEWLYEFRENGTFTVRTAGHFGEREFEGRYVISDSTVFLSPDSDWPDLQGVFKPRLRIMNDQCLRDYDNNYYCKDYETVGHLNAKELEFQEKAIAIIDTLKIVRVEKERLLTVQQYDRSAIGADPEIRTTYAGIFVLERREFHQFFVERIEILNSWRSLGLLVTREPFSIYTTNNTFDSLKLVYRERK